MSDEKLTTLYSHRLVTAIEETRKRPLHPSMQEAFLQVPRHLFIDAYYQGNEHVSTPITHDEKTWDHWLAQIYCDEALVTQRDEHGMPTSSSSQPSVMASMLEALDLHAGQTVLEIGTGTGYNAALMAKLVGDPHLVTTVDIDPTLVDLARVHIEHAVGPGMTVQTWNGLDGYVPHAPYDRIIATGCFFPVPWAWIEQLKPGGKLMMDFHGQIGGGLLLVIKQPDGQAIGHFLNEWHHISFMRLRSMLEEGDRRHLKGYQNAPLQEQVHLSPDDPAYRCASHFATFKQFRRLDNSFNLWLQWIFPAVSITWRELVPGTRSAMLIDQKTRTAAVIEPQENGLEVTVHGERLLWSDLLHAYQDWLAYGSPGLEAYTLHIYQSGRQVIRSNEYQEMTRTFPLTDEDVLS